MAMEGAANDTLASVGSQIHDLFRKLKSRDAAGQSSRAQLTNEAQRFDLWARNLGLYTGGHSSLDYRFRDAQLVFEHTFGLLEDLKRVLSQLSATLGRNDPEAPDGQIRECEAAKEYLSEDSDEEDISSYLDKPLFEILTESASDTIDKLYRLAFKIRNPAMRLGNSRAISYQEMDAETGVNLIDRFVEVDQQHVQDLFRGYSDSHPDSHYLISRLATANTRRRQQFRYWKKRRDMFDRLSKHDVMEDQREVLEGLLTPAMQPIAAPSMPSTATRLNVEKIRLDDEVSVLSTVSFLQVNDDAGGDSVSIPPPPQLGPEVKEFECPYCFTMCPGKLLVKRNWETHILHDLRPYICTYENCKAADQQYDSLNDWISHEALSHHSTGASLTNLENHSGDANDQQTAIQSGSSRDCPLCLLEDATALHIASHLQRIALFSLPRSTEHDETDEGSKGSGDAEMSTQRSRGSGLSLTFKSDSSGFGRDDDAAGNDLELRSPLHLAWEQQEEEREDAERKAGQEGTPEEALGSSPIHPRNEGQFPPREPEDEQARAVLEDTEMLARMQGALRRTPSPQQIFDNASKRVADGNSEAAVFMDRALENILQESGGDPGDHSQPEGKGSLYVGDDPRTRQPERKPGLHVDDPRLAQPKRKRDRATLQQILNNVYEALIEMEGGSVADGSDSSDDSDSGYDPVIRSIIEPFMELPRKDVFPDYYTIIQTPIAMDTIKERIERQEYRSLAGFVDDIHLLCENCRIYNADNSVLFQDADNIEKTCLAALQKETEAFPQFARFDDTVENHTPAPAHGLAADV